AMPFRRLDPEQAHRVEHYEDRGDLVDSRTGHRSQLTRRSEVDRYGVDEPGEQDDVLPNDRDGVATDLEQARQLLHAGVQVDHVGRFGGDVRARTGDGDADVSR